MSLLLFGFLMVGCRSRLELTPRPCSQVTGLAARTVEGRTVGQRDVANTGLPRCWVQCGVYSSGPAEVYNGSSIENMPDLVPVTGRIYRAQATSHFVEKQQRAVSHKARTNCPFISDFCFRVQRRPIRDYGE
ncbi:hypothetical protein EDB84DRAFT_531784 [Lactarius hengduanensis]|nr:hypothetical protein EDB84DRAFT_531784 [Lactarius hengduanensis]